MLNMSTLIATATDEICNFQTELKKKKKSSRKNSTCFAVLGEVTRKHFRNKDS